MSLKDGSKKMSKSDLSDFSRINLKDEKDDIINKIKKPKQMLYRCQAPKMNLIKD